MGPPPKVGAIHAGLECGILGAKVRSPAWDLGDASRGPKVHPIIHGRACFMPLVSALKHAVHATLFLPATIVNLGFSGPMLRCWSSCGVGVA